MGFKAAPLSSAFMATSIIGFLISVFYIWGINETWGFTLAIVFFIMLIASFVSMKRATPDAQLMAKPI